MRARRPEQPRLRYRPPRRRLDQVLRVVLAGNEYRKSNPDNHGGDEQHVGVPEEKVDGGASVEEGQYAKDDSQKSQYPSGYFEYLIHYNQILKNCLYKLFLLVLCKNVNEVDGSVLHVDGESVNP